MRTLRLQSSKALCRESNRMCRAINDKMQDKHGLYWWPIKEIRMKLLCAVHAAWHRDELHRARRHHEPGWEACLLCLWQSKSASSISPRPFSAIEHFGEDDNLPIALQLLLDDLAIPAFRLGVARCNIFLILYNSFFQKSFPAGTRYSIIRACAKNDFRRSNGVVWLWQTWYKIRAQASHCHWSSQRLLLQVRLEAFLVITFLPSLLKSARLDPTTAWLGWQSRCRCCLCAYLVYTCWYGNCSWSFEKCKQQHNYLQTILQSLFGGSESRRCSESSACAQWQADIKWQVEAQRRHLRQVLGALQKLAPLRRNITDKAIFNATRVYEWSAEGLY